MGLWARGYESLFAADALSATAALVKERLDLVILDLGLPCGDGFVMMERLRNNDYLAGISVSGLTGREFENPGIGLAREAIAFFQQPAADKKLS